MYQGTKFNAKRKIIVVGNEKGGCGKTTTSINIITSLLYEGKKVASIDVDARQKSLTSFIENRQNYLKSADKPVPMPSHYIVRQSTHDSAQAAQEDEKTRFTNCIQTAVADADFVVIDAPGSDNYLSRLAHSFADIIVTPINDSFLDLTVLAKFHDETFVVDRPGIYSEIIWDAKKERAKRDSDSIEWFVIRNRLTNISANNKTNMAIALSNLAKRLGCNILEGFSERVIYRELFLKGLSLCDVVNAKGVQLRMTHIAAREELRNFMQGLKLLAPSNSENGSVFVPEAVNA